MSKGLKITLIVVGVILLLVSVSVQHCSGATSLEAQGIGVGRRKLESQS